MELGAIFTTAQPAMSHHLKVLRDAGLVTQRKEATSIFYQRAVATTPFLRSLFTELDETTLNTEATKVIDDIHTERRQHSVEFFNSHAADFASHQALICEPNVHRYHLSNQRTCGREGRDSSRPATVKHLSVDSIPPSSLLSCFDRSLIFAESR